VFAGAIAVPTRGTGPRIAIASRDAALVIIVNKENAVDDLKFTELRRIFMAERSHWPHGTRITVAMLERGQPEREAVLRLIYGMREWEYSKFMLRRNYSGDTQSIPKTVLDAAVMKKFVAYVPGAIGYVRVEEADSSVKAIRIDARSPADSAYPLKLVIR
jgi:ABC-type phosphate transport system substrate-binding protein